MSTDNGSGDSRDRIGVSRRTWLHAIGAVGAGALAGCSGTSSDDGGGGDGGGNGNGNGNGGGTGNGNGTKERVLDEPMGTDTLPTDLDWNPYTGQTYSSNLAGYAYEFSGLLLNKTGEVDLLGYEDWSYNEKEQSLTITIKDGVKYWNGDPYTADDRLARDLVRYYLSPELWKDVKKVDDRTVAYYYEKPQNPDLLAVEMVHGTLLGMGADIWNPWVKRLENASSEAEKDTIRTELENFSVSHEKFMKDGLGTSPYKLTDVTQQAITFEKWDGHRLADDIEVESIRRPYASNDARLDQLVTNDQVDLNRHPLSGRYKGQVPEYIKNLATWRAKWLIKMLINWKTRAYLQDVNVRRAMAAVISSENVVTNVGDGYPIEVHSGMDLDYSTEYVGEELLGKYIEYGKTAKPTLADEFLKKSGYSRQNGAVVDKSGKPLKPLRFLVGSGSQWQIPAETAARQLKEYGFPVQIERIGRDRKVDRISKPKLMDSWDLTTESHYAAGRYHPLAYFHYGTFWGWRLGEADFGPSTGLQSRIQQWLKQGKQFSPYNGKPLTPEIPMTVGTQTLSGETREVNIYERIRELFTPVSEQRTKEIIRDLSWAWNFHLPDIDLMTTRQGLWGDTKHFDWSANKDALTAVNSTGVYYVTKQGLVSYK